MPYGVCPNDEHHCEFSYRSHRLAELHNLLQVMRARESLGGDAGDVSTLTWFARYFQPGITCKACGAQLCTALLATAGLDSQPDEYEKRTRLNHLLAITGELQAWGVLPA